uniref:Uncharacterized protein n=1 Tax=Arundo donax TaxID=35708 RepID=A0A0A9AQQ7_ARUDO
MYCSCPLAHNWCHMLDWIPTQGHVSLLSLMTFHPSNTKHPAGTAASPAAAHSNRLSQMCMLAT